MEHIHNKNWTVDSQLSIWYYGSTTIALYFLLAKSEWIPYFVKHSTQNHALPHVTDDHG
jgi:hypothetical protein